MSTFHWNTGQPSIFWTEGGERAAKRHAETSGKAMDMKGRAVVGMEPRAGSMTIATPESSAKTSRIRRGTST